MKEGYVVWSVKKTRRRKDGKEKGRRREGLKLGKVWKKLRKEREERIKILFRGIEEKRK